MYRIMAAGAVVILSTLLSAQPSVEWRRSLNDSRFTVYSLERAKLGYILTGHYFVEQGHANYTGDVPLAIVGEDGIPLWLKRFNRGETEETDEEGVMARQSADGGFIVAGSIRVGPLDVYNPKNKRAYLVYFDSLGNPAWDLILSPDIVSTTTDVIDTDFGFLVLGMNDYVDEARTNLRQIVLWAVSRDGELIWERTYGGAGMEYGAAIVPSLSGFVIAGSTTTEIPDDIESLGYLLNVDVSGNV